MKYQNVRNSIQTGDIILSSGSSMFSKLIKEATGCKWSHVAMAVWGQDFGLEPDRLFVWESHGPGVGETEFEKACYTPNTGFLSRITNYGAGDVAWRTLYTERTPQMLASLKAHCDMYRGVPYEESKVEMLKAVPWVKLIPWLAKNEQALKSQFCWECIAATYQAMGLLSYQQPANTYSNVDFASVMSLELGASLSELRLLEFK